MTQATRSTSAVQIVHATTANIYTAAKDSVRKEVPAVAEYIEREMTIRAVLNDYPEQVGYSREDAADCIRNMVASDVSQVRHGRWIDKGEYAVCMECGGRSGIQYDGVEPIPLMTQFCPNCGAKMDGGAD